MVAGRRVQDALPGDAGGQAGVGDIQELQGGELLLPGRTLNANCISEPATNLANHLLTHRLAGVGTERDYRYKTA